MLTIQSLEEDLLKEKCKETRIKIRNVLIAFSTFNSNDLVVFIKDFAELNDLDVEVERMKFQGTPKEHFDFVIGSSEYMNDIREKPGILTYDYAHSPERPGKLYDNIQSDFPITFREFGVLEAPWSLLDTFNQDYPGFKEALTEVMNATLINSDMDQAQAMQTYIKARKEQKKTIPK